MLSAQACYKIFDHAIKDYHLKDNVDSNIQNPFSAVSFESLLYRKNWIDTVQWHLEDIIRSPELDPGAGMEIKRRIDRSNQDRTNTVEKIDDYFAEKFDGIKPQADARINSETPAWLLDRMSILMLKIYHMEEQTKRKNAAPDHIKRCQEQLDILLEQKKDMQTAFDQLIEDIAAGRRIFKLYRQVKMYNDASLNPMLYNRPEPLK